MNLLPLFDLRVAGGIGTHSGNSVNHRYPPSREFTDGRQLIDRSQFKAHRLLYHSILGFREIKKKKKSIRGGGQVEAVGGTHITLPTQERLTRSTVTSIMRRAAPHPLDVHGAVLALVVRQ